EQADERLAAVRPGRMDDETRRLLNDRQIVVEVDDQPLGLGSHERSSGEAGRSPRERPCVDERSTSSMSRKTPTTIATSARLKVGQNGRSMKSVTAPSRTRSARLPSAPP